VCRVTRLPVVQQLARRSPEVLLVVVGRVALVAQLPAAGTITRCGHSDAHSTPKRCHNENAVAPKQHSQTPDSIIAQGTRHAADVAAIVIESVRLPVVLAAAWQTCHRSEKVRAAHQAKMVGSARYATPVIVLTRLVMVDSCSDSTFDQASMASGCFISACHAMATGMRAVGARARAAVSFDLFLAPARRDTRTHCGRPATASEPQANCIHAGAHPSLVGRNGARHGVEILLRGCRADDVVHVPANAAELQVEVGHRQDNPQPDLHGSGSRIRTHSAGTHAYLNLDASIKGTHGEAAVDPQSRAQRIAMRGAIPSSGEHMTQTLCAFATMECQGVKSKRILRE